MVERALFIIFFIYYISWKDFIMHTALNYLINCFFLYNKKITHFIKYYVTYYVLVEPSGGTMEGEITCLTTGSFCINLRQEYSPCF